MELHSPLEKALVNHVEYLTKEKEHEVQTCIKDWKVQEKSLRDILHLRSWRIVGK